MPVTYISRKPNSRESRSVTPKQRHIPAVRSATPSRFMVAGPPAIRLSRSSSHTQMAHSGNPRAHDADRAAAQATRFEDPALAQGGCTCGGAHGECGACAKRLGSPIPGGSVGSGGCPIPELQAALNATGAHLTVDGRSGPQTTAAVRAFQTAHPPLSPSGTADPATWTALHAAAPGNLGLPSGETTNSHGWGSGIHATNHCWKQKLTPATTDFQGCTVQEAPTAPGTDSCWFAASTGAPFTGVTGGTWTVGSGNVWGDDFVGFNAPWVTYYRTNGRAPCSATFVQSMRIVRPGGNVEYKRNTLTSGIGVTTVSSTRDGQTKTKTWP